MRQIKFRARRKLNGEWAYGCLILNGQSEDLDYIMPIHSENSEPDYWIDSHSVRVISQTIGQFTGRHDKNGKEIYEGDIILWSTESGGVWDTPRKSEVVFERCCFIATLALREMAHIEVVGNIHEKEVSYE